jgi:hypothetical protein
MEEELTPTENGAEKFFQRFDFSSIPDDSLLNDFGVLVS